MQQQEWQKIKEVFTAALEQPVAVRQQFLAEACGTDEMVRREVESLLAAHEEPNHLLEKHTFDLAAQLQADGQNYEGKRFGPYRILRQIGRGGMGAVFLAERDDGEFQQQVALKIIRQSFADGELEKHFRRERQILASLSHPHIAKLLDGGVSDTGELFLAMEFIEGESLIHFAENHRLSVEARLQLFLKICRAVSFAHQSLIIHRDLKPSNVLVTEDGEPKLLDFGLAKVFDAGLEFDSTRTETAFRAFTPAYAAPEQILGKNVTTASDVFSLGVILYELLTNEKPFHFEGKSLEEIIKTVTAREPSLPSRVVNPENPQSATRQRQLKGDLDNITLKALQKDPPRRYLSVEEFSEDIRRHLEGLPVIARLDTFAYRSAKFIKRNQIAVAAAALVLFTLIGGVIATAWQAHAARKQRDAARLEKAKAERINTFLQDMLGLTSPGWFSPSVQRNHDVTVKELLDEMANRVETEMSDQPEVRAAMQRSIGNSYLYQSRFDLAEHHLRAALETELKLYGEQNQETARTLTFLGNSRLLQSDVAGAETFHQRAVNVLRKQYATGNAEARWYVAACSGYGQALHRKGDLKAAADLFIEGLELSPQLSGNERAVIAIMLSNLAFVRADHRNLDEAEALHRQALKEFRELPGRTRWEMGSTLTGLGEVLTAKGQFAEAQDALSEGLDAYRTVWGDNSLFTAFNLNDQGIALFRLGDYSAAEEKAAKSLEIYRRINPEANASYASPLIIVGLAMNKTGRSTQAEALLRQALEIRMRALPQGSYLITLAKGALGECLTTQRRFAETEPLLLQSYDVLKSTLGDGHARTIEARQRLFTLYGAWGKPAEAARYQ